MFLKIRLGKVFCPGHILSFPCLLLLRRWWICLGNLAEKLIHMKFQTYGTAWNYIILLKQVVCFICALLTMFAQKCSRQTVVEMYFYLLSTIVHTFIFAKNRNESSFAVFICIRVICENANLLANKTKLQLHFHFDLFILCFHKVSFSRLLSTYGKSFVSSQITPSLDSI